MGTGTDAIDALELVVIELAITIHRIREELDHPAEDTPPLATTPPPSRSEAR